ncbi:hypothetical protein BKA82DRAFT_4339484 [Pisolithus tinctorius]|nr:hypothetical protein BKA82DRAFT_4339484 [Pisolithus tinctorius]
MRPDRGFNPGPPKFRPGALTTELFGQVLEYYTCNIITTENAKQMVKEAARVTMQELRGLWGWDSTHWCKVAQLMWAQLPKSHPYYKVMEELTGPLSRAEHQAQLVDKGKGKELGTDEAQGIQLPDTMAKTTGVAMQKPGNEEDQNREKARGCSQSRRGWPAAKPVNASDQTSRGQSWSRRPTKKVKPVDEDMQDWQDINNPPESWEVVLEAECWQGMLALPLYKILMQLVQGEGRQVQDAAKSLPIKASPAMIPRRHCQPSHHFNACCASSIDQSTSQTSKGTKLKSICQSIQSNKPSFVSWPTDWLPHGNYYSIMAIPVWYKPNKSNTKDKYERVVVYLHRTWRAEKPDVGGGTSSRGCSWHKSSTSYAGEDE